MDCPLVETVMEMLHMMHMWLDNLCVVPLP
jgi:hypothetical protein